MEENQKDTPTQNAGPTPVMDVQPPKSTTAPVADESAVPASTPIAVSTPSDGENLSESSNDDTPADNTAAPAPAPSAPKHHMPVGVIVTAIVVALLLIGLTVLAFMKSNDNKADQDASSKSPTTSKKVNGSDVTKTSDQLDQDINSVNDDTDFGTNDLSDSALGLQ